MSSVQDKFESRSPTSIVSIDIVDVFMWPTVQELPEISGLMSEPKYLIAATSF